MPNMPSMPVLSSSIDPGSGTAAGSNEATVIVPPLITDALPVVKFVASVLMTRTSEDSPGWILAATGGEKSNPTTLPAALRSPKMGATVPPTNGPKVPPSVRKPSDVAKPVKLVSVIREIGSHAGCPAPPQFGAVRPFDP